MKLIQHALFCKGYDAGSVTGKFEGKTVESILKLKEDAFGVKTDNATVTHIWFKAILNSDPYVCVNQRNPQIRSMQQYLNKVYNSSVGIIACNGHWSRNAHLVLISSVLIEINLLEKDTMSTVELRNLIYSIPKDTDISDKSDENLIKLLQIALYVNGYKCSISGKYDDTVSQLKSFQEFVSIEPSGIDDRLSKAQKS